MSDAGPVTASQSAHDTRWRVPPEAECDLIMKGGITSGVVYPAAILSLARHYRFRSIGGASAGAIAATAAAAAEYGREAGGGFASLEAMQKQLMDSSFLLNLFQPTAESRPLFKGLLFFKEWWAGRPKGLSAMLSSFLGGWRKQELDSVFEACPGESWYTGRGRGIAVAAVLSLLVLLPWALLAAIHLPSAWLKVAVVLPLFLLAVALVVAGEFLGGVLQPLLYGLRHLLKPGSRFGMCTGYDPTPGQPSKEPSLTAWMHKSIQEMAGLPSHTPLTLEHLRSKKIDFKAITADLSQGQPYALPLDEHLGVYVFDERDMRVLFPEEVVQWMIQQSQRPEGVTLAEHLHIFPTGDKLPLLVAMRMSLSFPVLLAAVRLYSVPARLFAQAREDAAKGAPARKVTEKELTEHWFSDGGIASNFPIHLFDSWIPRRPTFGINLRDSALPSQKAFTPAALAAEDRRRLRNGVLLPKPENSRDARAPMTEITDLGSFLGALLGIAQNYRDNTQAALPGYRERIAHVYLDEGEGGLNLKMPGETLEKIVAKGDEAARRFLTEFDFKEHQWVRLLGIMSRLELELDRICQAHGSTKEGLGKLRDDFHQLLEAQKAAYEDKETRWYRPVPPSEEAWFAQAERRLGALVSLMDAWAEAEADLRKQFPKNPPNPSSFNFFKSKRVSPHPAGVLRLTPEL
jgi:predicted acylesterase/phospholipase RssA